MANARKRLQPVSLGKYLLLEKIGSGGMAEIYRAKTFGAHGFEREYAIKKILPNLLDDREFLSMFIDEARIAAQLQHSNIVQVYDLGENGSQCYIAMECIHGHDLLELLARCDALGVRLPLKLSLHVVMEVLKGLEFAHKARGRKGKMLRIVHRDVSPCNVLLGYQGEVKLGDFGVAKASIQRQRTEVGMLKGKVGYMSPEQINGEKIDMRSDLFSCGVLLYEVLTMRRLFAGPNDLDVMLKIRDGDISEDLKELSFLPGALRDIVTRALARDRELRYQSARDFFLDLQDFLYRFDIRVSEENLGRFLRRAFAREYQDWRSARRQDPDDPTRFPDLQSPQVARYRFREPNGAIVGPLTLETLMSILRYRYDEVGCAVSLDQGPWLAPGDVEEVAQQLSEIRRDQGGIPMSHHLGMANRARLPTHQRRLGRRTNSGLAAPPQEAATLEGSLSRTSFPELLYALHQRKDSGLLTVTHKGVQKDIFIEEGAPGYVASNKSDELLGNFLCDHGILSPDQLQLALNRLSEFGGRLGDVLVSECMVPSVELFHYLSLQARQKMLEVFTWEGGDFSYERGQLYEGESYPLGINLMEIIVQGVRTRTPAWVLRASLSDHLEKPLHRLDQAQRGIRELNLTARELGIAASVADGRTLRDVLEGFETSAHVRQEDVWRVLFLLRVTHMLGFEGAQPGPVLP